MPVVLASCVPYFSSVGTTESLLLLLGVKPLTYLLFALSFRYRVSLSKPLSLKSAFAIAAVRAVAGLLFVLVYWFAMNQLAAPGGKQAIPLAFTLMAIERAGVWLLLGTTWVRLSGRRLVGWTISGTAIDAAFDVAVVALMQGVPMAWLWLLMALACFLGPLYFIGRRTSLKARFWAVTMCSRCGYDLTGSTSDACPECGTHRPPQFLDANGRPAT